MSNSTLTTNPNLLSPTAFKLVLDRTKYANVEYFLSRVTLPTVNIGEVPVTYLNEEGFSPGNKLTYDALSCAFMVDEEMKNYMEIVDWMTRNRNGNNESADVSLIVLNSHNNAIRTIRFLSAFPTSIGGLEFTTGRTEVEYLTADLTLRYDRFEIE